MKIYKTTIINYIISLIIILILTFPLYIIKGNICIDGVKPNLTILKKECNISNENTYWQIKQNNKSFCNEFNDFYSFGYCNIFFYFHWFFFTIITLMHFITFKIINKITSKHSKQNKTKKQLKNYSKK